LIASRAELLGYSADILQRMEIIHVPLVQSVNPGEPHKDNAAYILQTLDIALENVQQGYYSALVTGPVNKSIINDAGISFTGHTEYLAQKTSTERTVMMLVAGELRVSLVTTHVPLCEVPAKITASNIRETIEITRDALIHSFGIADPLLSVCGLNPHAGDGGHLGREEIEIITPCLDELREQGYNIEGPVSADTIFKASSIAASDAIVCMYHDQGLAPLKALSFGHAVNVTLGLPLVRTSVDHGTAFSVAGTHDADPRSLLAAIYCAKSLVARDG